MVDLPQAFDTDWNGRPTPLGRLGVSGAWIQTRGTGFAHMRRLDHYAMVLLIDGTGRYRDEDGRDEALSAGDVLVVVPGLGHQYGSGPGERWSEVFFTFSGRAFDDWSASGGLRPGRIRPDAGQLSFWMGRWLEIARATPFDLFEQVELLGRIHLLICDLCSEAEDGSLGADADARLARSRHELAVWPVERPVDWELLARQAGYTYHAWRRSFRKAVGLSPGAYRRQVLMERAASLLERSTISNAELAERTGCCDAYHFSKLFKAVHGVSPRDYRLNRRNTANFNQN